MATEHENEILARYSTPDLKRSELTRFGKMMNLMFGYKDSYEKREELLDKLYPKELK